MRLTKAQTVAHDQAVKLATSGTKLNDEEKEFVWNNYHPAASHNTTKSGAFFTPISLAWEAACMHGGGGRVIDFCAGIGVLGAMLLRHTTGTQITCIESNPEYVAIGKVLPPEAQWIEADALAHAEKYDSAISNPPFGRIGKVQFENAAMNWISTNTAIGAIMILPVSDHVPPKGFEIHEAPVDLSGIKFKETNIKIMIYDLRPKDS